MQPRLCPAVPALPHRLAVLSIDLVGGHYLPLPRWSTEVVDTGYFPSVFVVTELFGQRITCIVTRWLPMTPETGIMIRSYRQSLSVLLLTSVIACSTSVGSEVGWLLWVHPTAVADITTATNILSLFIMCPQGDVLEDTITLTPKSDQRLRERVGRGCCILSTACAFSAAKLCTINVRRRSAV